MSNSKPKALTDSYSDAGLGAALAIALTEAGLRVNATARNSYKMSHVESVVSEALTLEVQTAISTEMCISRLTDLDILVDNAGGAYSMPFPDLSIPRAKQLFDLSVWSDLAVTQDFLPLPLKSKGMIVNQTSVVSSISIPFQFVYNASQAAMAVFPDSQRLKLQPFGIIVVDLKTGLVTSELYKNTIEAMLVTSTKDSIYEPAMAVAERSMRSDNFEDSGMPTQQ